MSLVVPMDITQLRQYVVVVESGSFTKAAERLFISRQALSKSVRNLEHEMDRELLIFDGARLVPTDEGQDFLHRIVPVLQSYDDLEARYLGQGLERDNVVDMVVTYAYSVALPSHFFEQVESRFDVRVSIDETFSDGVVEMVSSGQADIGILGSCPAYLRDLDILRLDDMDVYLDVPKDEALSALDELQLSDLGAVPIVTAGCRDHLHRFFTQRCAENGIDPNIVFMTSDVDLLLKAAQDRGAAFFGFPEPVVSLPLDSIVCKKILIPGQEVFGTYAIRRKNMPRHDSSQTVWEELERFAAKVPAV